MAEGRDSRIKHQGIPLMPHHFCDEFVRLSAEHPFRFDWRLWNARTPELAQDRCGAGPFYWIIGATPSRGVFENVTASVHTQCGNRRPSPLAFVIAKERLRKEA